jgi:hypothetical protein
MSLIHNERTKLTANWLNTLAAGIILTGAVAPLVAAIYGLPGPARASYLGNNPSGARLACSRNRLTCNRAMDFAEAEMSWFQFYAFFVSPVLVLAIGVAVAYVTGRAGNSAEDPGDHRAHPAE